MKLIGILGAKGSGKSTAAIHMVEQYGFVRLAMAGPLKMMLKALGLSDEQLNGSLKEEPSALLCGQTPRLAMQTLGTEWRDHIAENLWSNIIASQIVQISDQDPEVKIVIDDIRFPHEFQMIRDLGGQLWCTRRPEIEPIAGTEEHISEAHWRSVNPDVEIVNIHEVEDLFNSVRLYMIKSEK